MTDEEAARLRVLQMRAGRMLNWLTFGGPEIVIANERRLIDEAYAAWQALALPRRADSAPELTDAFVDGRHA